MPNLTVRYVDYFHFLFQKARHKFRHLHQFWALERGKEEVVSEAGAVCGLGFQYLKLVKNIGMNEKTF